MRLRETTNEYGSLVVEYSCESCGATFTVCPAPEQSEDDQWVGCMATTCASYDEGRDVDRWFEHPRRVRLIPDGEGRSRLVPFRILKGGKQ